MKTKLTLSVEKEAVEAAKELAAKHGLSLSELVEAHFQKLTRESGRPSLAKKLRGIAADGPLSNMTYEEIREEYAKHQLSR